MATAVVERFNCNHCGKQFAWKPELAGRKAKCKGCGNVLTVPASLAPTRSAAPKRPAAPPPAPPPLPPQARDADNDDAYDFAEDATPSPPPIARAIPVSVASTPVSAVPSRGGVGALAYHGQMTDDEKRKADRFSFWAMVDMTRDIYVPLGMLLLGFGGIIAWAMFTINAGSLAIILVSVVTAFVTILKTIVLTLGAIFIAPRFGLSFGDLRTAILKIAAIIVVTDGASIWLPFNALFMMRGFAYGAVFNGMIIGLFCLYLFDMEHNETAMFAVPMALISKIISIVLTLVAASILLGGIGGKPGGATGGIGRAPAVATGAPRPARVYSLAIPVSSTPTPGVDDVPQAPDPLAAPDPFAAAGPAPAGGTVTDEAAAPAAAPVQLRLTPKDRAVDHAIELHGIVQEVREFRFGGKKKKVPVAEAFYAASAPNIYVDIRGRQNTIFGHMYVELPTDAANRAACFALAATPASLDGMFVDPSMLKDVRQKYLVLDVPAR